MNLKGNIGTMAAYLASILITCSCSIKEDRIDCPCILTINTDGFGTNAIIKVSQDSEAPDEKMTVRPQSSKDSSFVYKVKKGSAHIYAYTLAGELDITPYQVTVQKGRPWTSIFADTRVADCHQENAQYTLKAHKQFARLKIEAKGMNTDLSYSIFVHSSTCGFSLSDLSPVEGEFMCKLSKEDGGTFSTAIPRQGKDDLELLIEKDGVILQTIPIGESIRDKGYSWNDRDLDDIFITVDFAFITADITIIPWDDFKYDIEN